MISTRAVGDGLPPGWTCLIEDIPGTLWRGPVYHHTSGAMVYCEIDQESQGYSWLWARAGCAFRADGKATLDEALEAAAPTVAKAPPPSPERAAGEGLPPGWACVIERTLGEEFDRIVYVHTSGARVHLAFDQESQEYRWLWALEGCFSVCAVGAIRAEALEAAVPTVPTAPPPSAEHPPLEPPRRAPEYERPPLGAPWRASEYMRAAEDLQSARGVDYAYEVIMSFVSNAMTTAHEDNVRSTRRLLDLLRATQAALTESRQETRSILNELHEMLSNYTPRRVLNELHEMLSKYTP